MIVGITGGIGSGKTTVCKVFAQLGVPVYFADQAVHDLYDRYPELIEKISKEISNDVVVEGKLDRKLLSDIVFNDPKKLNILNSIVHPVVAFDFENWVETHSGFPYVLKEAAILFESGSYKNCDKIITVVAPQEIRIQRLKQRDKKSREEIESVMNRQWSDEEKIEKSDFVITNDDKTLIIPQVIKIHESLLKLTPVIQRQINAQ